MKPPFWLRKATPADAGLIQNLARATWPSAYAAIISPQQIDFMLSQLYSPTELQRQLAGPVSFLLLYSAQQPVGFAGFGPLTPQRHQLHKLYVLPELQGSGAGKTLLQAVLQQVSHTPARELVLQVNRLNPAVGFYQRMGFAIWQEMDLYIGNGFYMNDYLMGLELTQHEVNQ